MVPSCAGRRVKLRSGGVLWDGAGPVGGGGLLFDIRGQFKKRLRCDSTTGVQ